MAELHKGVYHMTPRWRCCRFISINMLASMLLLFTVLFSSWLYIAVSVPAADRTRPDVVQAVVARFSGESASDRAPSPPSPHSCLSRCNR